ncbi:MAG TPA: hypothetical protein VGH82_14980 [Gaiellaceae bacterium]|jgi:hypothetical protein
MTDRRTYQLEVERLLSQINNGMHDLRLLKVSGVRNAALAEKKNDLRDARARLASLTGAVQETEALAA